MVRKSAKTFDKFKNRYNNYNTQYYNPNDAVPQFLRPSGYKHPKGGISLERYKEPITGNEYSKATYNDERPSDWNVIKNTIVEGLRMTGYDDGYHSMNQYLTLLKHHHNRKKLPRENIVREILKKKSKIKHDEI